MSTKRKQNKPQKLNHDQIINKCNNKISIETTTKVDTTSTIQKANLSEIDTQSDNLLPSSETNIMTSTITSIMSPNNNLSEQKKILKQTLATTKTKLSDDSFLNKVDFKISNDDRVINNNSYTKLKDLNNTMNKSVDFLLSKENDTGFNNKLSKGDFDFSLKLNASEQLLQQQKQQSTPNYNSHVRDDKEKLNHLLNLFYLNNCNIGNNSHMTPPTTTSPIIPNATSLNTENKDYANFLKSFLSYTSSYYSPSVAQQQQTTTKPIEEMLINNLTPYLFNQAQIQMYQQHLQQQQAQNQGVNPLFPLVSQFPQLQTPQFTNPFQFGYNYQNVFSNAQFNQSPKETNENSSNKTDSYESQLLKTFGGSNNNNNSSNYNIFELLKSNMASNSNGSEIYSQNSETNKLKRPYAEEMQCSCGISFDSLEVYMYHLKQSNHKPKSLPVEPANKKPNNSKNSSFTQSKPAQNYDNRHLAQSTTKMVRGQEEWVNSSRNNNFISQVLKCLECSASFKTLDELSLHMVSSNHFSKFYPTSLSANACLNFQSMHGLLKESENKKPVVKANNSPKPNSAFSTCTANKPTIPNVNSSLNTEKAQPNRNQDDSSSIKCKLSNKNNLLLNQIGNNCKICNKKFNSQLPPLVELIQHLQNEHGITQICTNCGAHFDSSSELQTHLIEEQNFHNSLNFNRSHYKTQPAHYLTDLKQLKKSDAMVSPSYNNKSKSEDDSQAIKKLKKPLDSIEMEKTKKLPTSSINTVKQCLNSSTSSSSSSISPSSVSSSNSSNSSPSSFLFEPNNANHNKPNNSNPKNDKVHHPLLALQMFVNGNSQTSPYSSSNVMFNSSNTSSINNISPISKESAGMLAKLPAKSRPSVESSEGEDEEENSKRALNDSETSTKLSKLIKSEANSENDNAKLNDLNKFNLVSTNQCHPLHLLQKMHMNLDDFLFR